MHPHEALDVVHVAVEMGDEQHRRIVELVRQTGHVGLVAPGQDVVVAEVLGHLGSQGFGHGLTQIAEQVRGLGIAEQVVVDAVDHDPVEGEAVSVQGAVQPDRLVDRLVLGRGDDDEGGGGGLQHRFDRRGAGAEVRGHVAQQPKEGGQVREQVHSGHLAQAGQHGRGAATEYPHPQARGPDERLECSALEEGRQPAGGVQEVQRVARRRRVEHEQVEVAALHELVELGHGRELLGP